MGVSAPSPQSLLPEGAPILAATGILASASTARSTEESCRCLKLFDAVAVLANLGVQTVTDLPPPSWWAVGVLCEASETHTYSRESGRTYVICAADGLQHYIGLYLDEQAGKQAAQAFLQGVPSGASAADWQQRAAEAQAAARAALLGRRGFTEWRNREGAEQRKVDLKVEWCGKKRYLCSVRTEQCARAALDAFLSVAHNSVDAGLVAAKQVAAREAVPHSSDDGGLTSFISPCSGARPRGSESTDCELSLPHLSSRCSQVTLRHARSSSSCMMGRSTTSAGSKLQMPQGPPLCTSWSLGQQRTSVASLKHRKSAWQCQHDT